MKWLSIVLVGLCSVGVAWASGCEFGNYQATYAEKSGGKNIGVVHESFIMTSDTKYRLSTVLNVDAMWQEDQISQVTEGDFTASHFHPSCSRLTDKRLKQTNTVKYPPQVSDVSTMALQLRYDLLTQAKGGANLPVVVSVWWNGRCQQAVVNKALKPSSILTRSGSVAAQVVTLTAESGAKATYWFDPVRQFRLVKSAVSRGDKVQTELTLTSMTSDASHCVLSG